MCLETALDVTSLISLVLDHLLRQLDPIFHVLLKVHQLTFNIGQQVLQIVQIESLVVAYDLDMVPWWDPADDDADVDAWGVRWLRPVLLRKVAFRLLMATLKRLGLSWLI